MKNKIREFSKNDCISFKDGKELKEIYKAIKRDYSMSLEVADLLASSAVYLPTITSVLAKEEAILMGLNICNAKDIDTNVLKAWNDLCEIRNTMIRINHYINQRHVRLMAVN